MWYGVGGVRCGVVWFWYDVGGGVGGVGFGVTWCGSVRYGMVVWRSAGLKLSPDFTKKNLRNMVSQKRNTSKENKKNKFPPKKILFSSKKEKEKNRQETKTKTKRKEAKRRGNKKEDAMKKKDRRGKTKNKNKKMRKNN